MSMGFSRQVYWSGLPSPPPGDLPYPGIEPRSPELHADSLPSEPPGKPLGLLVLEGHCCARRPLEQVWRGTKDSLQPRPDFRDASGGVTQLDLPS